MGLGAGFYEITQNRRLSWVKSLLTKLLTILFRPKNQTHSILSEKKLSPRSAMVLGFFIDL